LSNQKKDQGIMEGWKNEILGFRREKKGALH
jgi:hypothetical protein